MRNVNRIENDSAVEEYGDDYLIYCDGSIYKGELQCCENSDSIRHGYGIMTYSDGVSSYTGYYKDNIKHGKGTLVDDVNGTIYDGDFENGVKSGKGKFMSLNGNFNFTYEGEFENNIRSGKGKYVSHNDNIIITYDGEWSDDIRHGYGKYSYIELYNPEPNPNPNPDPNQSTNFYEEEYEGFWINDKKDGKGELKIKGLWRNNNSLFSSIEEEEKNNKNQEKKTRYESTCETYCKEAFYYMFPPDEKYEFY
jgi:hypothetical protein